MSAVVDAVVDIANAAIEAVEALVVAAWDSVVEPLLEVVFALFGIVDETVVTVQKVSSPLYATHTENVVEAGISRAILTKVQTDTSFFPNYMQEIYKTKGQMRAYYRYGELGLYYEGLPLMRIQGTRVDFDAVQAALDEVFGSTHTVLGVSSHRPTKGEHSAWTLQDSHDYKPWLNTLTAVDAYGVTRDDWALGSTEYNSGPDNYTINISRQAEEAQFWIQGPGQITEGDTATFTIKSNRPIPLGETVTISFAYTGDAVDATDYTQVASVDMLELTDEVTVDIVTLETANANRVFTITIDSVDNTGPVFEEVTINAQDSVSCTITDDDTLRLTVADVIVDEANTTITIPVTLSLVAPSGAFSVDYNFTDLGSTSGGVDYDNTTGTLNFAGTAGEVQNISIDIYADIADDDKEQFEVFLENSDDVDSIDISAVATVTIIDGTLEPEAGTVQVDSTITKASYTRETSLLVTYSDDSDPPEQFWYWIYPHSTGTYDLEPVADSVSKLEMMPLAILRKEKENIDDTYGRESTEFVSTRMLMIRNALKIDDFLENLSENPDIDDVDDAYFNFAMQPKDSHPLVAKLLYLAFYQIIVEQGLVSNVNEFSASLVSGDIQNAVVWKTHSYTQGKVGVVTDVGEYKRSRTDTNLTLQYQATETTYDQLKINQLNGLSAIEYDGYHEVAMYKLGDDEFTIPLSWDTFAQLEATEMMEVYQYLVRVDFNAINITEIAWYESEAFWELFDFVMIVVMIVITVYSFGTATSFAAGLYTVISNYVISYAIGELIVFIAEETGNQALAAVIGAVAAVALANPEAMSNTQLMTGQMLLDGATNYVNNMSMLEGIEQQEMIEDMEETIAEEQKRIKEEQNKRNDIETVGIDSEFMVNLKSQSVGQYPAIQGQYDFNELYNYDTLVANFFDTRLAKGVT